MNCFPYFYRSKQFNDRTIGIFSGGLSNSGHCYSCDLQKEVILLLEQTNISTYVQVCSSVIQ